MRKRKFNVGDRVFFKAVFKRMRYRAGGTIMFAESGVDHRNRTRLWYAILMSSGELAYEEARMLERQ